MRGERLRDAVSDSLVFGGGIFDFDGDVAARVPSWREKVWMNDDVARALLNQS